METVTRTKAVTYLVIVPLLIGSIIFITIAGAIGLVNIPFINRDTPQLEIEELTDQLAIQEETIETLRTVIENQKDEMAAIRAEYVAKENELIERENELNDYENELNDRENIIQDENERIENLANNFSQMRAKDAASILTHMEDEEIIKILSHMNNQKVSDILSALDSERAAALALAMMGN